MNLCEASKNGDFNTVSKLLANGADPNIPDGYDSLPLHHAAEMGHLDIVKALLAKGADINTRDRFGQTPLYIAVEAEKNVVINFLLGNGADPEIANNDDNMPLHIATRYRNVFATQILLSTGTRQNLEDIVGGYNFDSHWLRAIREGGTREERIMLAFDNQPYQYLPLQASLCKASSEGNFSTVKKLLANGAAPNITSVGCELTPLHHAALKGHLDVVKTLLANGAQVNSKDHLGDTPLVFAVESGHNDIVNHLLANGANPNIPGQNEMTPLHRAALTGNLDATKTLMASGANPERKDKYGRTAWECARVNRDEIRVAILNQSDRPRSQVDRLCEASSNGNLNALNKLLRNGADPNFRAENGLTPLHCSVWYNRLDVVKILLAKGAHVNSQFNSGETPLLLAIIFGNNDEIINILLAYGANPNIPDELLKTPLHLAAHKGKVTATKILLANGANRDLKDWDGQTAFKCAQGVRKKEIQEAIQNYAYPMSLKAFARTCIRSRLIEHQANTGQPLSAAIQELPLPRVLKTYLFNPLAL